LNIQIQRSHIAVLVRITDYKLLPLCVQLIFHEHNSADGARILLGTAGCELYEMSAADGSVTGSGAALVSGHGGSSSASSSSSSSSSTNSSNITKATAAAKHSSSSSDSASSNGATGPLAVHPGRAEYVTGGADGAIRVWDALSK
jgi:hypothetical protein